VNEDKAYDVMAASPTKDPLDQSITELADTINRKWAELQGLLDQFETRTERMVSIRSDFRLMRGAQTQAVPH
jgi:hypothetical protein